jgi:hypothetical protein
MLHTFMLFFIGLIAYKVYRSHLNRIQKQKDYDEWIEWLNTPKGEWLD